jgi:hypothetical protein
MHDKYPPPYYMDPKVHSRIQKSPKLFFTLNQMNPVRTFLILYRVMDTETPFGLLIRCINNFTSRNYNCFLHCYTFTQLTILTRQSSILSESLLFTWRLPTANCLGRRAEQSRSVDYCRQHSWHRAPLGPMAIYLFSVKTFVFFFLSLFLL